MQPNMASHRCPECDQLVKIHPTGITKKPGWSAQWWEIEWHGRDRRFAGKIIVEIRCDGSGKRV